MCNPIIQLSTKWAQEINGFVSYGVSLQKYPRYSCIKKLKKLCGIFEDVTQPLAMH